MIIGKHNPYGLTTKQTMVIEDVKKNVELGKGFTHIASTQKFYAVKNKDSARTLAVQNMQKPNFREAMIASLTEKGVLGPDGKVEVVLREGLDATDKDGTKNFDTRLKYAQEINKIAGVYAAEKKQVLNLNMDMSEEELDKHIEELREQV
jgi:hypothetical protein